jgi:hypothetical protein
MQPTCSSENSVHIHQTTRRCIPDNNTLHNNDSENLKSYVRPTCPQNLRTVKVSHQEMGKVEEIRNVALLCRLNKMEDKYKF